MSLGCKPLFDEPPVFDMQAIVAVGEDTSSWRQTVTGIWGDATAQFEGEDDVSGGYLILYQENQKVKGISTTGNSIWSGVFQNGELIASYTFGIDSSKSGEIRLALSADGSELIGDWSGGFRGFSRGEYAAYRMSRLDSSRVSRIIEEVNKGLDGKVTIIGLPKQP